MDIVRGRAIREGGKAPGSEPYSADARGGTAAQQAQPVPRDPRCALGGVGSRDVADLTLSSRRAEQEVDGLVLKRLGGTYWEVRWMER